MPLLDHICENAQEMKLSLCSLIHPATKDEEIRMQSSGLQMSSLPPALLVIPIYQREQSLAHSIINMLESQSTFKLLEKSYVRLSLAQLEYVLRQHFFPERIF